MGSAIQSHSEMTVMMAISASVRRDTSLRWMANRRKMPKLNSRADSTIDMVSVIQSGSRPGIDKALR